MFNTSVTRVQTDRPPRLSNLMQSKSPELDFPSSAPEAPSGRKKAHLFFRNQLFRPNSYPTEEISKSNLTAVAGASPKPGPTRRAQRNSTLAKIVERPQDERDLPSLDHGDDRSPKGSMSHVSKCVMFSDQVAINVETPGGTVMEKFQETFDCHSEDDDEYVSRRRSSIVSRRSSGCSVFETFSGQVHIFVKSPDGLLQVSARLSWTPELLALSLGISTPDWIFSFRGKSLTEDSPLGEVHGLELGSVVHATPARLLRARTPLLGRGGHSWRMRNFFNKAEPFDIKSGAIMAKLEGA